MANIALSPDMANAATNYAISVIGHNNERHNDIRIFNNPQFGEIRTILNENNEPLFCASDLCLALGYSNSRDAVARHIDEDDVVKRDTIDSLGRNQTVTYVTESGMYSLVFGSKLDTAKQFKHWVTSDVLPTLRRTGSYSISTPINPQIQSIQAQFYIADALSERLRLNDSSRLGMYQSIAEPYGLAIPQYVPSKGVLKSARELLAERGLEISAQAFNKKAVEKGYLCDVERNARRGQKKRFKSITQMGLEYGENLVNPNNPRSTQPSWYADRFDELFKRVMA